MAIEDNTTFEQREITIRIALRRIMFMGRGLVLNWLDREVFVRWTQKMASTFVHSIEKKNQCKTHVKHQHLLWRFNTYSIWFFELADNTNKLINFAQNK